MAGFRDIDRALFPIKSIASVIQIFRHHLERTSEPDLALLSIIVGAVENSLTCGRPNVPVQILVSSRLPSLEYHTIEVLYNKFYAVMKGAVDVPTKNTTEKQYATRELVKKVSDAVWNTLLRSYYKDRAHLQSFYSYLTGNKLDCFGVAFAVVAGCQALGFADVHLALSEDHAWVVFGEHSTETAEVTGHGKGNEDKRGQEIGKGVAARSWLYVNNKPVICTRTMEVAALVSAINPSLNATHDVYEVAYLQQELLWLLYDLRHLAKYPMAIGNLGDLEEISSTPGRIPRDVLFREAISSARSYYDNMHVYPYTYQGGYFYRNKMYKEAFGNWANASDVIRKQQSSRDSRQIIEELSSELMKYDDLVKQSKLHQMENEETLENLKAFLDNLVSQQAKYKEEVTNLKIKISNWERRAVELRSALKDMTQKFEMGQKDLAQLQAKLSNQVKSQVAQNASVENSARNLKKNMEMMQNEFDVLKMTLDFEMEQKDSKIEILEKELKVCKEHITILLAEKKLMEKHIGLEGVKLEECETNMLESNRAKLQYLKEDKRADSLTKQHCKLQEGRHMPGRMHGSPLPHNVLHRSVQEDAGLQYTSDRDGLEEAEDKTGLFHTSLPAQPGISRQQLINSLCPICGDKISGFHYGIFSCESCKTFFKRTVQNRKSHVCLRGAACPVTVATRRHCSACRFNKCLQCGMKLDVIREDRTRGGRSTYECSYSLPPSLASHPELRASATDLRQGYDPPQQVLRVELEPSDSSMYMQRSTPTNSRLGVPPLLQVTVSEMCKTTYEEIKKDEKHRYVIFVIKDETQIDVEVIGARDEKYDQFLANLQAGGAGECRYGLYDFEYMHQCQGTSESSKKQKLFLMSWCPHTAEVKKKMLYSSSFDALKKSLVGVQKYIQVTHLSEASQEAVEEKLRATDHQ